ncbi:MAG: dephospho-CoA kinase [Candidatus Cyclobacteriaceae bacterium M3_2C_046]
MASIRIENPFKVGITGGIGAGKSLVCQIFRRLDVPVYQADERAKYLMSHNPKLKNQIIDHFGNDAYDHDHLNRTFLAQCVFNKPDQLDLLNKMVHPIVNEDYQQWITQFSNVAYTLKEAALIFETGSYKQLNKSILVYAPEKLRIERTILRDQHRNLDQVKKIMEKQMDEEKKKALADYVLINDDRQMLLPQVLDLHEKLIKLACTTN